MPNKKKITFTPEDRKVLTLAEMMAIDAGYMGEEEISSLISSRLNEAVPQAEENLAATVSTIPDPVPEESSAFEDWRNTIVRGGSKAVTQFGDEQDAAELGSALRAGDALSASALARGLAQPRDARDLTDEEVGRARSALGNLARSAQRDADLAEMYPPSKAMQEFQKLEGFGPSLSRLMQDPLEIGGQLVGESLIPLAPALVAAFLTKNPAVAASAMGANVGLMEHSAGVAGYYSKIGVAPEDIDKQSIASMREAIKYASTRGSLGAAEGMLTGGISSLAAVPKSLVKSAVTREGLNIATVTAADATLGAGGEYVKGQATGFPATGNEMLSEAVGEVGPASLSAAIFASKRLSDARAKRKAATLKDKLAAPIPLTGIDPAFDEGIAASNKIAETVIVPKEQMEMDLPLAALAETLQQPSLFDTIVPEAPVLPPASIPAVSEQSVLDMPLDALGSPTAPSQPGAIPTPTPLKVGPLEAPSALQGTQPDLYDNPALQEEANVTRDMFSGELSQRESPPTEELRQQARAIEQLPRTTEVDLGLGAPVADTPLPRDFGRFVDRLPPATKAAAVAMNEAVAAANTAVPAGKKSPSTKAPLDRSALKALLQSTDSMLKESTVALTTADPPYLPNTMEQTNALIEGDKSMFGDVARKGVASGKVSVITSAEAEALRPGLGPNIRGWYARGDKKIYVVGDRMDSEVNPVVTVAHEIVHAGLQRFKADKFPGFVSAIERLANSGNKTAKAAIEGATDQLTRENFNPNNPKEYTEKLNGEIVAYATHLYEQARREGKPLGRVGAVVRTILSEAKLALNSVGIVDTADLDLEDISRLARRSANDFFEGKTPKSASDNTTPEQDFDDMATPVKSAAPASATSALDPAASANVPAMRRTSSGIELPAVNVNVSKKEDAKIATKKPRSKSKVRRAATTAVKLVTGKSLGQAEQLMETALGAKTAAIHKVSKTVERLRDKLGVTPAMIAGVRAKSDPDTDNGALKRSAALRAIKALPRGEEAYLLTVGLMDDLRQMSYDGLLNAVKAKRLPDGSLDVDSLSDADYKFLLKGMSMLDTYARRAYEYHLNPEGKKQRQEDTHGAWEEGLDTEGAKDFQNAVDTILTKELLPPDGDPEWPAKHKAAIKRMYENWGYDPRAKEATLEHMVKTLEGLKKSKGVEEMQAKAVQLAKELIGLGNTINSTIYGRYSSVAINRSTLKKKQNVPPYVRRVWGEIKDPWFKMANTYVSLAELTASQQLLNQLKVLGDKHGILEAKQGAIGDVLTEEIRGDQYGDLNGMRTTPAFFEIVKATVNQKRTGDEVTEALLAGKIGDGTKELLLKAYDVETTIVRHAKAGILLGTLASYVVNYVSAYAFLISAGNLNLKHWAGGKKDAAALLRAFNNGAIPSEQTLELLRGGVVDGVVTGDVREHEDRMLMDIARKSLKSHETALGKKGRQTGAAISEGSAIVRQTYASADIWSKFANYRYEKAYLREDYAARGEKISEIQLQQLAADRTNRTNPTYGRASPAVRVLDKIGVVPFSTFMAEIPRVLHNGTKLALLDIFAGTRDGNGPRVRNGAKRLAGTLASVGLFTKIVGFTATMGAGIIEKLYTPDDEDEDLIDIYQRAVDGFLSLWGPDSTDEDIAVRGGMGKYLDGADLIRIEDAKNGNPRFLSMSRFDPRNMMTEGVVRALRAKGTVLEKLAVYEDVIKEGIDNATSRGIFQTALADKKPRIKRKAENQYDKLRALTTNATGGRVGEKGLDKGLNIVGPFRLFPQIVEAKEEYEKNGMSANVFDKLAGTFVMEFDPIVATSEYVPAVLSKAETVTSQAMKDASAKGVGPEAEQRLALKAVDAEFVAFSEARRMVVAAQASGMSNADIKTNLLAGQVDKKVADNLISGTFKPKDISKSKTIFKETLTSDANSPADKKAAEDARKSRRDKLAAALKAAASDPKYKPKE